MNPRIRPSMVDIEIQKFSQWKESLEQEDLSECGSVVKRSEQELQRMWSSYWKFQNSTKVNEARTLMIRGEFQ